LNKEADKTLSHSSSGRCNINRSFQAVFSTFRYYVVLDCQIKVW